MYVETAIAKDRYTEKGHCSKREKQFMVRVKFSEWNVDMLALW